MKKCNIKFIVNEAGYIEKRTLNGDFLESVCCKSCYKDLERCMVKFSKFIKSKQGDKR